MYECKAGCEKQPAFFMTEYFTTPVFKVAAVKLLLQLLQWRITAGHHKKVKNKNHIVNEALLKNL
jgi:hypothetical protein